MQVLQAPLHREGHHRIEALAGECLEVIAPATHLTSATCTRAPEGVNAVECTTVANVLRTTALGNPGVYAFDILTVTGFATRLVAIVFPADALDYPRIARDVHRQERPIVARRLILRGVACATRLDVADAALNDAAWWTRGDLVGESGPINFANWGA